MKDMFDLFSEQEMKEKPPKTRTAYRELFNRYNHAYKIGEPEISDAEYDAFLREYYRWYPDEKNTKVVGAPVDTDTPFTKAQHEIPMGSLENAMTEEEFRRWGVNAATDQMYCLSEKLDGISIEIIYWGGAFRQAITRGDGHTGEDITRNVRLMKGVPMKLPVDKTLTLRGEIVMFHEDFELLNAEAQVKGLKTYANPRNATAGIVRRLDGTGCERLTVLFYNNFSDEMFHVEHQKLDYIKNVLKLGTPWYSKCTFEEVIRIHNEYEETKRKTLPYDIDGMVAVVNSISRQEVLGGDGLLPKWAIAYKFDAATGQTPLEDVVWQAGRTGVVSPVAKIKPIKLGGVTITNVTLHNVAEIERLGVEIGHLIEVKRSGDVIPKVTRTLGGQGKPILIPTKCPVCDAKLTNNGVQLRCVNQDCTAKTTKGLILWLEKLDVMQFGEKLVEQLEERGLVREPADIYKLQPEDIANIEGRGHVTATKVLEELHSKKTVTLDVFLAGLSIPSLSDKTAKLLSSTFGTMDKVLAAEYEQYLEIAGVAEKTASALYEGIQAKRSVIQNLLQYVKITEREKSSNKLEGKSFCFTGFRDKSLEVLIESHGGKIASGVSKNTSYLLVDNDLPSSKRAKAQQIGVPIIMPSDLEEMLK